LNREKKQEKARKSKKKQEKAKKSKKKQESQDIRSCVKLSFLNDMSYNK
jgi:hypothetical protein